MMILFFEEWEQEAIIRIQKFAKIADKLGFEVAVGFSGGKDSQVVYDLCKRAGIKFKAYYNVSFESNVTKKFIRENYPEVIWRKDHKFGFIENIIKNHEGLLPMQQKAFCCFDYKHNPKYVDDCSIIGVRKVESQKRATRTAFVFKNKTLKKKLKADVSEYFLDKCQSIGSGSKIQLLPIVEWTDKEVWYYISKYNLPINPEYKYQKRIGCIVCPKANFLRNYIALLKYPKLIDAFIKAKEASPKCDWKITSENKDLSNDKVQYICRWLNHSFMPFTKKQYKLFLLVKKNYEERNF
jgi:phosphoadenosine phosphosulfate reductase